MEPGVDQWQGLGTLCNITNLSVVSTTDCDPATNTYDLTFEVNWEGAPESGNLAVNEFSYLVVAIRWSKRSICLQMEPGWG